MAKVDEHYVALVEEAVKVLEQELEELSDLLLSVRERVKDLESERALGDQKLHDLQKLRDYFESLVDPPDKTTRKTAKA